MVFIQYCIGSLYLFISLNKSWNGDTNASHFIRLFTSMQSQPVAFRGSVVHLMPGAVQHSRWLNVPVSSRISYQVFSASSNSVGTNTMCCVEHTLYVSCMSYEKPPLFQCIWGACCSHIPKVYILGCNFNSHVQPPSRWMFSSQLMHHAGTCRNTDSTDLRQAASDFSFRW